MDQPLTASLAAGTPPFDGQTLCLPELLPLEELVRVLGVTVTALRARWPEADLLHHEDWLEHDGYITNSKPFTWAELMALVASPEALYVGRPSDDFVRTGVYSPTAGFYLRVWVPDENDDPEHYPGRWGSFDLSANAEVLAKLEQALPSQGFLRCSARSYFNQRSAA